MHKIVPRVADKICSELAGTFPVVAITGPRQSGKTTLAQTTFPKKQYVSLEDPDVREAAYSRKILDGKVDWRIQVNVRNAFGDDDDIPVITNPDGQVDVIRIPNPRTITLSNSFRF